MQWYIKHLSANAIMELGCITSLASSFNIVCMIFLYLFQGSLPNLTSFTGGGLICMSFSCVAPQTKELPCQYQNSLKLHEMVTQNCKSNSFLQLVLHTSSWHTTGRFCISLNQNNVSVSLFSKNSADYWKNLSPDITTLVLKIKIQVCSYC